MPALDLVLGIVAELFKLLLPGSVLFLLVGMTLGVALLLTGEGRRMRGRAWLTALAIGYWLLSLPVVAGALEQAVGAGYAPLTSREEAGGARHVVVLTGGGVTLRASGGVVDLPSTATALRLLETERLYRLLDRPTLLLSGGPAGEASGDTPESEAMKTMLVARGIPADRILLDTESQDTRQQAVRIRAWLEAERVETFVLVTSRSHMRRALGALAAEGLSPIPSAAEDASGTAEFAAESLLPSPEALSRSHQSIREIFALLYYSVRGWMG